MILRWRVVPLRVPWMKSRRSGVNARTAFAVLSLVSLLPAALAHGEVSTGSLGRYRPYSVRDVGDRVFFTSIPEPGKPHEFNIYELRKGTDSPRPLLTPEQARQFRPSNTLIPRPGKSGGILLLSGQLEESASGEMWTCFVLVDADSGEVKPLARNGRDNRKPSFSRDGRKLAFWSGSGKIPYMATDHLTEGYALHVLDIEAGHERELVKADPLPVPNSAPAWSPDGKRIAFVCALDSSLKQRIHIVNEDGTGLTTPQPDTKITPECVVWPAMQRVLFNQFGSPGLFELDLQSPKVTLAKEGAYQSPLEIAPDGKSLRTRLAEEWGKPNVIRVLRLPGLEHAPELENKLDIP